MREKQRGRGREAEQKIPAQTHTDKHPPTRARAHTPTHTPTHTRPPQRVRPEPTAASLLLASVLCSLAVASSDPTASDSLVLYCSRAALALFDSKPSNMLGRVAVSPSPERRKAQQKAQTNVVAGGLTPNMKKKEESNRLLSKRRGVFSWCSRTDTTKTGKRKMSKP